MRSVQSISQPPRGHWVGDGFPVRSLFSPGEDARELSPFLLLDYAEPSRFGPAQAPRGVGEHPHRGFETVTVVYQGELEHRDSAGNGGKIGPGDVQWMTAASGILHEEFHSAAFTRDGGTLEMVQLWVNLPARHKGAPPRYQTLRRDLIPTVDLPDGAGTARVIAGSFAGSTGPAETFTPLAITDVELVEGGRATFDVPENWTALVVVLHGMIRVSGGQSAGTSQVVRYARTGGAIEIEAEEEGTKLLLLSGEPIDEPVVAQGPFVMNAIGEIKRAMLDYRSGKFGTMA